MAASWPRRIWELMTGTDAEALDPGNGFVSAANSTATPLGSGATFTGRAERNTSPWVMCSCQADNDGTLYFDFSVNGEDWTTFPVAGFRVQSGVHEFHTAIKGPRYFRVRLVNDVGAQSYLRLYVYFGPLGPGNAPLNQSISLDSDAISVRPTSFQDEVRIGRRPGVQGFTKFGYRSGLTAANGYETVWGDSGDFTPMDSAETFTVTYNDSTDGAGADGALTLSIQYIDADGLPASAIHTLGNDGSDVTSFTGLGINRCAVASSGASDVNTSAITLTATTAGTVQAVVPAGDGVTEQAIYFTGANHDAVAKYLFINVGKGGGGTPKVRIRGRVYSRAVQTWYSIFGCLVDASVDLTVQINDPIGFNLSPTDVLVFDADTDTNGAEIYVRFSLNEYQRT